MAVQAWSCRALALLLLATALSGLPTPETEPKADTELSVENTTLSTELRPPPNDGSEHTYMLFVINLYGLKNSTGETSEEMFENEITEKVPEMLEPLASVLLVIEADEDEMNSSAPVDLDELAKDLETEGFNVEKINHAGETRVVRVRLDGKDVDDVIESTSKSKSGETTKVRRKRTLCLKCKKGGGKGRGGFGGGGGGWGGGGYDAGYPSGGYYPSGGGGGCYPACGGGGGYHPGSGGYYPSGGGGGHYPAGGGHPGVTGGGAPPRQHPPPQMMHPTGGGCNTCQSGGAISGSYAQAESKSFASAWGK